MKLKSAFLLSMLSSGAFLSAQMPGMMTMQSSAPQGTTLGANTTSGAAGIALGNRVVMRGFVDFQFQYEDGKGLANGTAKGTSQTEKFETASDIDFLFDFSPVTAEVHLDLTGNDLIEQAYGRYGISRDFNISFGRQLTALGYEADEKPGLQSVSHAYLMGVGRNYVDGVRANFNNGRFGLTLGMHDNYFIGKDDDTFTSEAIAIDLAASMMIIPGLEAQLGYATQEIKENLDWSQFNTWIAYNPNDLTLAFEYNNADKGSKDYWSMLFLGNYQFNQFFGATLKYSLEDEEDGTNDSEASRFTFAFLFTITQNLFFNVEYSRSEVEEGNNDYDVDEIYMQALINF
jgi:hypothetical protein